MSDRFVSLATASKRAAIASDVVVSGNAGFISGVGPFDLYDDRAPLPEYVEAQTAKVFANLEALLDAVGFSKDDVVAVHISIVDYERLVARMNDAYAGFFRSDRLPTRSCVGVSALTRGALVEMDFVVHKAGNK